MAIETFGKNEVLTKSLTPSYILKYKIEDFQVNECYIFDALESVKDNYHYCLLQKAGLSTMDALYKCSEHFGMPTSDITFLGLKDEDAYTQQLLCIKASDAKIAILISAFNKHYRNDKNVGEYLNLIYLEHSPGPLKVGEVLSNSFLLKIRKVKKEVAYGFQQKCITFSFVNYYGWQRFGLPNEEPMAHRIGFDILNADYKLAIEKIANQNNNLGKAARLNTENPELFISSMDCRQKNFFLNSYYSYLWNEEIKSLLLRTDLKLWEHSEKDIRFLFPTTNEMGLVGLPNTYSCAKIRADDVDSKIYTGVRPLIVQTFFYIQEVKEDECFPGYFEVKLKFVLPTGCYATMAVTQLMFMMQEMHGN